MLAFIRAFGDGTYNLVWAGRSVAIWTAIEMNVAIVCVCLPPLRLLVMRLVSSNSVSRSRSFISNKVINGADRSISMEKLQSGQDGDVEKQVGSSSGGSGSGDGDRDASSSDGRPSDVGRPPTTGQDNGSRNKICVTTVHTVDYEYDCASRIAPRIDPSKGDVWAGQAI